MSDKINELCRHLKKLREIAHLLRNGEFEGRFIDHDETDDVINVVVKLIPDDERVTKLYDRNILESAFIQALNKCSDQIFKIMAELCECEAARLQDDAINHLEWQKEMLINANPDNDC